MYREGFERLAARMRAVEETRDPLFDLLQLGHTYRDAALENPHFYDVMFGRPIPQFTPDADDLAASRITRDLLAHTIVHVIATGALVDGADADDLGQWLWAVVHGVIGLELNGTIEVDDATYDEYLRLSLAGYVLGP